MSAAVAMIRLRGPPMLAMQYRKQRQQAARQAWVVLSALGVLAAAVTTFRWPGTAAAVLAVLAQVAHGPSVVEGLVAGLLVATHLVLLDGLPRAAGLLPLAIGAALTTSVVLAVVLWAVRPSVSWVLAASVAAPLALLLASSDRPGQEGNGR